MSWLQLACTSKNAPLATTIGPMSTYNDRTLICIIIKRVINTLSGVSAL